MNIAVSGMQADQAAMQNNSANIANSATIGYMEAASYFSAQVSQGRSTGANQTTHNVFDAPGTFQSTSRALDLAVTGRAFLPVQGPDGVAFKKTASCMLDEKGMLLDEVGNTMLGLQNQSGVAAEPKFPLNVVSALEPIQINAASTSVAPTSNVVLNSTLPAQPEASQKHDLQMEVYDSLGIPHTITFSLEATGTGLGWTLEMKGTTEDPLSSALAPITLDFDGNGVLTTPAPDAAGTNPVTLNWDSTEATDLEVNIDLKRIGVMGEEFLAGLPLQDGSGMGTFVNVEVGRDGQVSSLYSNGKRQVIAKIPLAKFAAVHQLERGSGNLLTATTKSGDAVLQDAGTIGVGNIQNKTLVASATDLMENQVKIIELSQANTANASVFSVAKEVNDTVASLMRS